MLRDEEQHQLCGHPPQRRGNRKVSLGKQLHLIEGKIPLKKDQKIRENPEILLFKMRNEVSCKIPNIAV